MLLLPTPVRQTAHGYSPELCKRARLVPKITTFVFLAFTLNPLFSMASFHIKSLPTHSSRGSAMMTRSSAYILCTISLAISCFASLCAHLCVISNNFNLRQMKPRIYKRHPLNRHLGRARIAGGGGGGGGVTVSKIHIRCK